MITQGPATSHPGPGVTDQGGKVKKQVEAMNKFDADVDRVESRNKTHFHRHF